MVQTVGLFRLDRIMAKDASGRRVYSTPQMHAAELEVIKACVRAALGMA